MIVVNWLVRIVLLFILAVAGTVVFFIVKDVLKELKHGSR